MLATVCQLTAGKNGGILPGQDLETARRFEFDGFLISSDRSLLQFDRVHRFLSEEAYWCLGVPRAVVEKAAHNSFTFGVYTGGVQIGYARVVSDSATFAWLCDVYIEKEFRGRGLSKRLTRFVMQEPALQSLRRICLATKDAHGLYAQYGFKVTESPENWMEIKNNNIYQKTERGST